MMRLRRKRIVLIVITSCVLALVGSVLLLVGPWPVYRDSLAESDYLNQSLDRLSMTRPHRESVNSVAQFRAGWAARRIAAPDNTALAGYGARKGKPASGTASPIFVKALAVSDGTDLAVIVGSDLLIVPENIADQVREQIAETTVLSGDEILFNASHNHSGPGGFAPGVVSEIFNGPYRAEMEHHLVGLFVETIQAAVADLSTARVGSGSVSVPEFIRNRERKLAPVDDELSVLLLEQSEGRRCVVVSYSAHPTVIGSDSYRFSGDYPGFLMSALAEASGAEVIYLGGAVGSMGHRAPEGSTDIERAQLMGQELANRVVGLLPDVQLRSEAAATEVVSIGFEMSLPAYQVRLNRSLRFSKYLLPLLGVDHDAWLQGVRIGQQVFVGTPADFCGEISVRLKAAAAEENIDLWVLSFNGDYVGYISPDQYYDDLETDGTLGYERGIMSWLGPHQEAYVSQLIEALVDELFAGE